MEQHIIKREFPTGLAASPTAALLVSLCLTLSACRSTSEPANITFSKVPIATSGGPHTSGVIEGEIEGAQTGQKIVLYAKAHSWWLQPSVEQPLTDFDSHGHWSSKTHLGMKYAALLVDSGYQPKLIVDNLPTMGDGVRAVAVVDGITGDNTAKPQILHFSDYDWEVSDTTNAHLGTMHRYKPDNIHLDSQGFLHLAVSKDGDQWNCAQVSLTHSLGYGTYKFSVQDVSHLEPAAVLGLYTRALSDIEENRRELNISLSHWGDPSSNNAEYVVQPYYVPQNVSTFTVAPGRMTYSLNWTQASASFATSREDAGQQREKIVHSHIFTSGIPAPGGETVHINFCLFGYGPVPISHSAEVVIEKFQYLP